MPDEITRNITRDLERALLTNLGNRLDECSTEEILKILIFLHTYQPQDI